MDETQDREHAAPLKIMVVDDDEDLRLVLHHLLKSSGYAVTLCSDALVGLEQLRDGLQPDIIVLDLMMPAMTGWEFRIVQKREPRWASIPVLALSGDLSPQAAAIDAAAYLSKPVDHGALLQTLGRMEKELRRSRAVARASEFQRLVSLGTLVGGIAHEINNPLTFMGAHVHRLQRALARDASFGEDDKINARHSLDRVRAGLDRIANVVKSVSLFAFAESTEPETLDVHEVLEASLQVASNELRHTARLLRNYEAVPHVRANGAKLGQVFLNLLLNAVGAVREHPRNDHEIRVQSAVRGELVVITIADSASTVRGDGERPIFDPVMADSSAGRLGLRFGLAVSRELVESMGGTIEIEPNQPEGSRLLVLLPRCDDVFVPPPALVTSSADSDTRPRVLVIDDEPLICELFKAMLRENHDVVAITEPFEALTACDEEQFDVILCDVMMPELDGITLYERAVEAHPELRERFIFVTGGVFSEPVRNGLQRTQRPVVPKPCGRYELLAAIRATTSAGARRT